MPSALRRIAPLAARNLTPGGADMARPRFIEVASFWLKNRAQLARAA